MTVGKLFRWLNLALELRIEDVLNRRAEKEKQRKDRELAIANENKRIEKRDGVVEKALAAALKVSL